VKSIADLEQEIRNFINGPRKQNVLLQDTAAWTMLCSCLDTIGDTELAIAAYFSSDPSPACDETYLLVYGVLQVLFVQQDAVENLWEALSMPSYTRDPALERIRDIRNNSVGHPTKRRRGKGYAYNFIARATLTKTDFRLMTVYRDEVSPRFEQINIPSLIEEQRKIICSVLQGISEKLRQEETEHRAQYRNDKLGEVFPPVGYYFQKIYQAIAGSHPPGVGGDHVGLVADIINAFRDKVKERGLEAEHECEIKSLDNAMSRLRDYFDESKNSPFNAQDAEAFVSFIETRIDELKGIASEIDETYESEP